MAIRTTKLLIVFSVCLTAVVLLAVNGVSAQEYTIGVWAGGSNKNDAYRADAIEMAADILMREQAIRGENITIKVEKQLYSQWEEFKQGITLAAESGKPPHIVVTGHEDIAPWANSGLIRKIEDFVDLDSWPINNIYPNLLEIASYEGVTYGLPQDAESRPFFFWRPYLKAIGYSQADIDALPGRVQAETTPFRTSWKTPRKSKTRDWSAPATVSIRACQTVPTTGSSTSLSAAKCSIPARVSWSWTRPR